MFGGAIAGNRVKCVRTTQVREQFRVLTERWRIHYNTQRLHSSLGYKPPAPQAVLTTTQHNPIITYKSGPIHGGRSSAQRS
jgi:hypothetical protein